jgi:serine O-acetyltransferase
MDETDPRNTGISASVPDWSREQCGRFEWHPSKQLLRSIRLYQRLRQKRGFFSVLRRKIAVLEHRFWSTVCSCDVPIDSQLGGGLALTHPVGVVIHPSAKVGPNCLIFQQVTLGYGGPIPGGPEIGGHVDIGAGAKILGGVRIGNHAQIGANAVVIDHVPAGATAVGVPARIVSRAKD